MATKQTVGIRNEFTEKSAENFMDGKGIIW